MLNQGISSENSNSSIEWHVTTTQQTSQGITRETKKRGFVYDVSSVCVTLLALRRVAVVETLRSITSRDRLVLRPSDPLTSSRFDRALLRVIDRCCGHQAGCPSASAETPKPNFEFSRLV